ncbi:MAG: hypothetical protein ACLFWL_07130 [Candidatus Brocadiia bacterium]
MPERKATITLGEEDIQHLEQALLDEDAGSAMQFLREVVKPRVDKVLNRHHCRPVFEWGTGEELRPTGPPDDCADRQ